MKKKKKKTGQPLYHVIIPSKLYRLGDLGNFQEMLLNRDKKSGIPSNICIKLSRNQHDGYKKHKLGTHNFLIMTVFIKLIYISSSFYYVGTYVPTIILWHPVGKI